ncbi:MAG: 50S ribosomal protein L6 [Gemmatimonadota bacterium]|nr:MAG: 50S ribosomal protein L6 [Gemmatimonadota bacterium]
MSRIGKEPIEIPQGVEIEIQENRIQIKGPKGTLSQEIHPSLTVTVTEGSIAVTRPSDTPLHRSLHGLTRTLLANMVEGVTKTFQKQLEITGVGYRAEQQDNAVVFQLGYSHPIVFRPPEGITITIEKGTRLSISGIDKQMVGQVAAKIRSFRPPDPYKAKGIKYEGEYIRRKAGKAAI